MKFDRTKFSDAYAAAFKPLTAAQQQGLNALLTAAESDSDVTDLRWLAYMLATVKHECADRWQPIEEFGKGKGHNYGVPVTVKDDAGTAYTNVYYGRGYVQLTWDYNYRKMGNALDNRLLFEPELALDSNVAYAIMSAGMRKGSFTGVSLAHYIHDTGCDYVNARKIINGVDQAAVIAEYATKLEAVLRGSADEEDEATPVDPAAAPGA